MPKFPRVSGERVVRVLETLGFSVARQKGSHIMMRRGSSRCVVPNHKAIKIETLFGMLRQADVSKEEFLSAYNKRFRRHSNTTEN